MKKYLFLTISLALVQISTFAQKQNIYDAFIASANELNGTARFMGVGGAMGALGGDASTIFYNPAGIGIYKSSELTVSANINWDNTSLINSNSYNNAYTTDTNVDLQHVAYVGTWNFEENRNLLNFNVGFAYNQSKKFARVGNYNGDQAHSYTQWLAAYTDGIHIDDLQNVDAYHDNYTPWASIIGYDAYLIEKSLIFDDIYRSLYDLNGRNSVNQNIKFEENGSANDFAISFAGNFNNLIYWGMSFECDYISYGRTTFFQETFADRSVYTLHNTYALEASGFTYKIGLIAKPTSWLRIGAAFHTPTWYSVDDYSSSNCTYSVYDFDGIKHTDHTETPSSVGRTTMTGPLKAIGSLGFVIGNRGFIGVDYQYENSSAIDGNNNKIKNLYSMDVVDRHVVRAGAEFKPLENLSLRIGGGITTPAATENLYRGYYLDDARTDTDYYNEKLSYNVTAGAGYRFGRHSIDLAYIWQVNEADYYSYSPTFGKFEAEDFEPIGMRSVRNQLVLTYSVRF